MKLSILRAYMNDAVYDNFIIKQLTDHIIISMAGLRSIILLYQQIVKF